MQNTDEFNSRIAGKYIEQLDNRDSPHSKTIVTFCGVPGSGKTTLAEKLTADLNAQYVHNDSMRRIIESEGGSPEQYKMAPIGSLVLKTILQTDANKCIVLDASIDRSWKGFLSDAKAYGVPSPVIIRLNPSYETLKQRQLARDGRVNANFDTLVDQFELCKAELKDDIEIGDEYDYSVVLKQVQLLVNKRG